MISAANALRPGEPLTDEEMKNRVCTCQENPDGIKKRHEKKDAAAGKKKRGRKPKQQQ